VTKEVTRRKRRRRSCEFTIYQDTADKSWLVSFTYLMPVKGDYEAWHRVRGVASAYHETKEAAQRAVETHKNEARFR
jgi:hypothetical protein